MPGVGGTTAAGLCSLWVVVWGEGSGKMWKTVSTFLCIRTNLSCFPFLVQAFESSSLERGGGRQRVETVLGVVRGPCVGAWAALELDRPLSVGKLLLSLLELGPLPRVLRIFPLITKVPEWLCLPVIPKDTPLSRALGAVLLQPWSHVHQHTEAACTGRSPWKDPVSNHLCSWCQESMLWEGEEGWRDRVGSRVPA